MALTQLERRTRTRGACLDAALDTLVEHGSARFTTTLVCRRAGISQGALFRYFPTKAELLAAVCSHLFTKLRDEYTLRFRDLNDDQRTIGGALDLLWDAMCDPRLAAAFDLYTDARTDSVLRESIEPVVRAHLDRIAGLAADLAADLETSADAEHVTAAVELAVLSMQGWVLNHMACPNPAARHRLSATLRVVLPELLGPTP